MNPDAGDDAEDFFAKFEREAREAAQRRAQEEDAAAPPASSPPPVAPPPAAAPPPLVAPQLNNPFDPPVQPYVAPPVQPAAQPPVQPSAPAWDPPPTQAMPTYEPPHLAPEPQTTYGPGTTYGPPPGLGPEPTQAMPTFSDEPTQALVPAPLRPPGGPEHDSALDALFGEDAFREYQPGPDPNEAPFAARGRSQELVHVPGAGGPPPPSNFGTPQKVLAGVGGGLLAVIALIALFLLGTRLPDLLGPAPAVVASPTPTPTPTRTPLAIGPVEPGTYDWDELLGGECLEPYDVETGAWAEEYTVVDCATPHAAQMVFRAWFPPEPADPEDPAAEPVWAEFPGAEALQAQISLLCSAPGVVDLAAAGAYSDAQMQGAYPVTEEKWETDPSYYCFVSRSSGEPLTTSVAIPRAPVEPVQPAPGG
ncbi:hypothetical protein [Pseudolysinimonas sp.]|uniref:hypothetical protein n=1 Tax=Pseudolysinimonas sp. TaxID=2680009 RepID=UPI00286AF3EC|nr:hypothetical protein [Pseudolysinimonas sp.]